MSQLNWVTPSGSIANLLIGYSYYERLLAVNLANPNDAISYSLNNGSLPPGLSLSSTGQISGTPTSVDVNFYSTTYSFSVRAISTDGALPADQSFSITITNVTNQGFYWVTAGGSLGTIPANDFYQLPLITSQKSSFSFISGALPPGMQVVAGGYLQGVPTLLNSLAVDTSETFRFTIRATDQQGQIQDQSFSISITNVNGPVIEPATTSLGSYFDGTYYYQQLTVAEFNPNVKITWSNIGQLPPGITLSDNGLLSGYILPMELVGQYGPAGYDGSAQVTTITAGSFVANAIYQITSLGTTDFTQCGSSSNTVGATFYASGPGSGSGTATLYNTVVPSANLIAGINYQIEFLGNPQTGLTDFTTAGASTNTIGTIFTAIGPATVPPANIQSGYARQYSPTGQDLQEYDFGPYDFQELNQSVTYSFAIQAYDGANYDIQKYILNIVARTAFTSDTTFVTADNFDLTVDSGNIYLPVILNSNIKTLPTGRAGSNYAFKFEGYDFADQPITYSLVNNVGTFDALVPGDYGFDYEGTGENGGSDEANPLQLVNDGTRGGVGFDSYNSSAATVSNLPGLSLDAETGWLYGNISAQTQSSQDYSFAVVATKSIGNVLYSSQPDFVTLTILGDVNNTIVWNTDSDLGSITTGSISELSVSATSRAGKNLVYSLVDKPGVSVRLPQGLKLLSTGDISGRVSFESFSLDGSETTFDGSSQTYDRTYNFTVQVSSTDQTVSSTREFTVMLDVLDTQPYENLYLQAMPGYDQRQIYNSVISNTEIFPPSLIYRPADPWFGVQQNINMLFLSGLKPSELATYANAMIQNHYTKTYSFGDIKTAIVLDQYYNIKYEVVYIEIIDPELNQGNGPPLKIDLTNTIQNPYVDISDNTYKIIYPNTSQDMATRISDGVGYYDQGSLPNWMTSNQAGNSSQQFGAPLGYIRAAVLAYTLPGASNLIAYRLRNEGINFNSIEFKVDRYLLDNYYSSNFNINYDQYYLGRETTFDSFPHQNVGTIVASVDYGVAIPFDEINGKTVDYINANGGLDGITNFQNGDSLIFVQQENFPNGGSYSGWINYEYSFFQSNISNPADVGYGGTTGTNGIYDPYTIIPGYTEKTQQSLSSAVVTATGINVSSQIFNFTGDGSTKIFSGLDPTAKIQTVTVNNTVVPLVNYNIGGGTIQFQLAPVAGASIQVITNSAKNIVTVNSTSGLYAGSTIIFTGTAFGGIQPGYSYSVSQVIGENQIAISAPAIASQSQSFIGDGSTTQYILSQSSTSSTTAIFVSGVQLVPNQDYVIIDKLLQFTQAPGAGTSIQVTIYSNTGVFNTASGSMTATAYTNQRGGVWTISIINQKVNLIFSQEINVNERISIQHGKTYAGAVVYYNNNLQGAETVPYYSVYKVQNTALNIKRTTFNADSTKFFSYRDNYYAPGTSDIYLKFPQYGTFD